MSRQVDLDLRDALAEWLGRGVAYHGQRTEYATVTQVTPALVLELQEGRESLSEDAGSLVIPKDQRVLFTSSAPAVNNTAVVTAMPDGRYMLHHVVDDQ